MQHFCKSGYLQLISMPVGGSDICVNILLRTGIELDWLQEAQSDRNHLTNPSWQTCNHPLQWRVSTPFPPFPPPFPPQDPFLPHPRPHDATNVGKKPGNQPEPERAPVPHDTALVAAFLCRVELSNEVTTVGPFTSQIPPL